MYSPIRLPSPILIPAMATICVPREITSFVAQLDASISLRFQVHIRVEQHIFADTHASAPVNRDPPLHDHGCGQALAQVGGKRGMSVDTCKTPQQRSSTTQKSGEQPA